MLVRLMNSRLVFHYCVPTLPSVYILQREISSDWVTSIISEYHIITFKWFWILIECNILYFYNLKISDNSYLLKGSAMPIIQTKKLKLRVKLNYIEGSFPPRAQFLITHLKLYFF